jgi:hypothetical protein
MRTTRFSCRLCMIRSHTVVLPDARGDTAHHALVR